MENNIPEDIVMDILIRLPAKSLMAFRCVCKAWRDLFRNPEFINKHHLKQTSLSKDKSCFLVRHGVQRANSFSFLCTVTDGGGDENEMLALTENISIPFTNNFLFSPQVLGPCNGLLCISSCDKCFIWNPAIREFKPLPVSPLERPPDTELTMFDCVGFGFDRKSNDYKFLRFVRNYFHEGWSSENQVELYSLKSDSWREISSVDVLACGIPCFYPYTTDGVYYWWAEDGRSDGLILSFDFADEVFGKLPLPDFGVSWYDYVPQLSIFNGLFAVILYAHRTPERWFDIWVMTERGVKESWVKEVSIGPISGVERPLAFWKNGALFLEDTEGQVVLYDPSTKELKNLQLHGYKDRIQVIEYVESLVPLNGSREEDGDEPFIRTRILNL